jgi:type IV secretion system protein VirD4
LLHGALHGDQRTVGNTITTVQQAMSLFFQGSIRRRCVPTADRPTTDIRSLIDGGGTIYLLGRDDPYASASPLMTAVTEDVLDLAKRLGETSEYGRLCPPFLACLDELPSTAPIPTLATRLANERALGVSFILAAQTWRQFVVCYGVDTARTILGLSNNLVIFGGGKDIAFYRELSALLGSTTQIQHHHAGGTGLTSGLGVGAMGAGRGGGTWSPQRVPVMEPAELRTLPPGRALVVPDSSLPLVARLRSCIAGRRGRHLLAEQSRLRRETRHPAAPDRDG